MKKTFVLNQSDITWAWRGTRTGGRKTATRASAAVDTSSWLLVLKHKPTGIEVKGEIPAGYYSNKQMQAEKDKLWKELQEQLRSAVAKHLRLSGQ